MKVELTIHLNVLSSPYVPDKVKFLCKNGTKVVPIEVHAYKGGKNPLVIFEHDARKYQLVLSNFFHPPSVEELKESGVPYLEKEVTNPESRKAARRYGVYHPVS